MVRLWKHFEDGRFFLWRVKVYRKLELFYYYHDVYQYVPHVLELQKSFKKSYQPAFYSK